MGNTSLLLGMVVFCRIFLLELSSAITWDFSNVV